MQETSRGFKYQDFKDRNDKKCSIQKSSLATEDAIWFGVDDPWIDPVSGMAYGRMHLTQDMMKELMPILQKFVDTGELE